jgi:hypothetical protein
MPFPLARLRRACGERAGRIAAYSASKYVIMSARLPLATTQGCSNSAICIHEPSRRPDRLSGLAC